MNTYFFIVEPSIKEPCEYLWQISIYRYIHGRMIWLWNSVDLFEREVEAIEAAKRYLKFKEAIV